MAKSRWTKGRRRLAAALFIALAAFIWGLMLLQLNIGQELRRASYDLPFLFDEDPPPQDIVMVYLDESSHSELEQPLSEPWDRRLHAKLVDQLAQQGARLIVFDILFHDEKPEQDEVFAAAIRKHGNVVLAGELVRNESEVGSRESLLLATPDLRRAAAGWGLTAIPIDPDGVVRQIQHQIPTDFGDKPSLAEIARQRVQGHARKDAKEFELVNYHGPAGTFHAHRYAAVLKDRGIPEGAFRDKIVIIGARQQAGLADSGKDTFPTPYARMTRELSPGMEIHATALANLLQQRGITRLPPEYGVYSVLTTALILAAAAGLLGPTIGVPLCFVLGCGIGLTGIVLQQVHGVHFMWSIPALGQMPLIVVLSLGAHYFIEYSARWKLRRAFKSYMSDEQARQIDDDEVSLELGGREVEVTILFSDLADFTTMSERLPPQALSKALICYFESATEGILNKHGTIIKYIGDAVLATWGAPLKVDRECERGIEAAIQMQIAGTKPVALETSGGIIQQVLETRVGIHHGLVLAGNLGSSRRFDYTVVGDSVNTAARLEGLNKMLGTSVLVSEAVLAHCADPERFLTRKMGSFVLKGKTRGIIVHEILGHCAAPDTVVRRRGKEYLAFYQNGLDAFERGDMEEAAASFGKSLALHDRLPEDPASRLFLESITSCGQHGWTGEVLLDSK